jgi:hypothetical protein
VSNGKSIYVAWRQGNSGHAVLIRGYREAGTTREVHYFCSTYNKYYTLSYEKFLNKEGKYKNWHGKKFTWKETLWNARK